VRRLQGDDAGNAPRQVFSAAVADGVTSRSPNLDAVVMVEVADQVGVERSLPQPATSSKRRQRPPVTSSFLLQGRPGGFKQHIGTGQRWVS
jgi:hypothetical protein